MQLILFDVSLQSCHNCVKLCVDTLDNEAVIVL